MTLHDEPPPVDTESARRKVALPAIFMIVGAVTGMVGWLGIAVFRSDLFDAYFELAEQGREAQGLSREQLDRMREQLETAYSPVVVWALAVVATVLCVLVVVGATRMRQLRSPGLALTASIASILSVCACMGGCCVLSIPAGIWAAIVLQSGDVRAAFDAVAESEATE